MIPQHPDDWLIDWEPRNTDLGKAMSTLFREIKEEERNKKCKVMNKYRVYYTEKYSQAHSKLIDIIYGYSEEDALLRAGIRRSHITSISQVYI